MSATSLEIENYSFQIDEPCRAMLNKKNELYFDPPVFKQRYGQIFSILLGQEWRRNIKKIVEFGCAEFGLFTFLKQLVSVEEICFVDINKSLLEENLYRLRPLTVDFIRKRSYPLSLNVFMGNVIHPDYRLEGTDAVLAVELIEHLYPDILEAVPYNIFSYIKPKLFIVTTPNAEFNVLFSKMRKKFRHPDHKFEWTREQFQSWATNLTVRFPEYHVSFTGVGLGPHGKESLGYCSQIAIFVREDCLEKNIKECNRICESPNKNSESSCDCDKCKPKESFGVCTYCSKSLYYSVDPSDRETRAYFELIDTIEYPNEKDCRPEKQIMLDNLMYKINSYTYATSFYYNEEKDRFEIPLSILIYDTSHNQILSVAELRTLLAGLGYAIEECKKEHFETSEPCVVYQNDQETDESENETSEHEVRNVDDDIDFSDWDADP